MTDPITRARKEWCEPWLVEFDANDNEIPVTYDPCPPAVVAALLDVLSFASMQPRCDVCGGGVSARHRDYCLVLLAEAAIEVVAATLAARTQDGSPVTPDRE